MKRLFLFLFCLSFFLVSNAQYPKTNLKQTFGQGVGLGSKDSTAFNANDSLVASIDRNGRMMYRGNGVNAPFRVVLRTVDSLSGGYTSWNLTKKKIDSLGFIVSGGFVPYTGATTNVNLGTNRLTARSLRMDSVIANGSGGAVFVTNSGNASFSYGAGGSSEVTFNGFAGYNANRASSYTARSFVTKNDMDSADVLRPTGSGTINTLPFFNTTNSLSSSSVSQVSGAGISIRGTSLTDGGQLGSELLSGSGWTSTNWTGSFAAGWTHTVGFTTALSNSLAAVIGTYYQITYTVTGRTAGTFNVSFGGQSVTGVSASGAFGPRATSTGNFVVNVTSDFNGTIVFSIKQISASSPIISLFNSALTGANEVRNFFNNTNVGYGFNAGLIMTSGINNSFLGSNAGASVTTGQANSFFGNQAGAFTSTSSNNSFFGNQAGIFNTIGSQNTFLGSAAGGANVSGSNNTFVGFNSGAANSTGATNVFIGVNSGANNSSGGSNTYVGNNSGLAQGTGSNNVMLGRDAGRFTSTGVGVTIAGNSVIIGTDARPQLDNQTNQIVIGDQAFGNGSNTTTIGNSSTTATHLLGGTFINGAVNDGLGGLRVTGRGLFSLGVTAQRGNFTSLILNKDSLPITTTNIWGVTIDTINGRGNRINLSTSFVGLNTNQAIGGNKIFVNSITIGATNPSILDGDAGAYPRWQFKVDTKTWEHGYRSGITAYEIREDETPRLSIANGGAVTLSSTLTSTQFRLSALNTAPSSASDTGTLGEIRIDANFIYICTATNTWKRVAISSW